MNAALEPIVMLIHYAKVVKRCMDYEMRVTAAFQR